MFISFSSPDEFDFLSDIRAFGETVMECVSKEKNNRRLSYMNIHQATINDLDSLTELFDFYRLFYKQESDLNGARAFLEERLIKKESVIFITYDDGEPVGFTQLFPSFSSVSMQKSWVLNDLYVKETARRKGVATELINKAIGLAEETKAKGILLETGKENVKAQKLYETIGFTKDSNYYYYYSLYDNGNGF